MPPKKSKKPVLKKSVPKKPKKPVAKPSATTLQKQSQDQRIVVNVNPEKAKRQVKRRAPQRKAIQSQLPAQISVQPIISMSGSVPIPQPFFNPSPVQSSGGFNPTPSAPSLGTPISISEPVVLPVFANESARVIGDENVSVPTVQPVSSPEPIIVPIKPVIPDDRPIVMPRPAPPPPTSIISTKPPLTIDKSEASSGRFLLPTPPARSEMKASDDKSISTLFNEISKDTGITSQSIADFIFKKKKPKAPPSSPASVAPSERSIPESISSMGGFNAPSEKSSIKQQPIIAEPKEVVVLKKPEVKMDDPYSIFSDSGSIARDVPVAEDIASDVATIGTKPPKKRPAAKSIESESDVASDVATKGTKPPKKRPVLSEAKKSIESESEDIIIIRKPPKTRKKKSTESLERRLDTEIAKIPKQKIQLETIKELPEISFPEAKEKKSNYKTLGELQQTAKDRGIPIVRPTGKKKTRDELRLEILGVTSI